MLRPTQLELDSLPRPETPTAARAGNFPAEASEHTTSELLLSICTDTDKATAGEQATQRRSGGLHLRRPADVTEGRNEARHGVSKWKNEFTRLVRFGHSACESVPLARTGDGGGSPQRGGAVVQTSTDTLDQIILVLRIPGRVANHKAISLA